VEGLCKLVAEEGSGKLLGVHIIGPHATELIAEAGIALRLGATARDVARSVHAHPTLAEVVMQAAQRLVTE
jgi:dihydrolipoamide dehydrogenase